MPKIKMERSPDRSPSPPAKRPRAALNFSIESIMQPSECKPIINKHDSAMSSSGSSSGLSRLSAQNSPLISIGGRSHDKHHQQPLDQVECVLENKTMWDKFHSLNTEMIITKTGRRMFPVLKIQFLNLDPTARYAVSMDIVPVDNKRYRYAYHKSCWQVAGKADPSAEPRLYPHPDSPFNGDLLGRQTISFEKVKLTNNEMDKSGHLILNSMHKYQPRIHLILLKSQQAPNSQRNQQMQLDIEAYKTFTFPETVFTAVTAYQNQLITKMKIEKNPFAKGFRDSSRLSDLDRNDPFDGFMSLGPVAAAACAAGTFSRSPGSLETAAAGLQPGCSHMDQAYSQLLAAASNSPWSSVPNAATQIWLAAFSACLRGSNE